MQRKMEQANNAYTMPTAKARVKYLHQCLFSPPTTTLISAIHNNQLSKWPGLTESAVRRYLQEAPATSKGHMKRPRQGSRSTRPKEKRPKQVIKELRQGLHRVLDKPETPDTAAAHHIFCYAALADKHANILYLDATGTFPYQSIDRNQAMLVAYDYTTNVILVEPMKNFESNTICAAFQKTFKYLESKGYKPTFNVLDNQASKVIKEFLVKETSPYQFVEPHNHRVNACERAIQTWKNHFISGLCTTDRDFPTQLWDQLLPQAQDTLNLLRPSRTDPTRSAYAVLEGDYEFDKLLVAPPGTRAVIHEPADSRASWAPRGTDAWYLAPAKEHYRAARFFVPETSAYRISASAKMFPQHCSSLPEENTLQHVEYIAEELDAAITRLNGKVRKGEINKSTVLQKVAQAIRCPTTDNPPRVADANPGTLQRVIGSNNGTLQRVADSIPTSTNPTAPRVVKAAPRTHKRRTRRNQPGTVPLITPPPLPRQVLPLFPYEEGIGQVEYMVPTPKAPTKAPAYRPPTNVPPIVPTHEGPLFEPVEEPMQSPTSAPPRRSRRLQHNIITQEAINFITHKVYTENTAVYEPDSFAADPPTAIYPCPT